MNFLEFACDLLRFYKRDTPPCMQQCVVCKDHETKPP